MPGPEIFGALVGRISRSWLVSFFSLKEVKRGGGTGSFSPTLAAPWKMLEGELQPELNLARTNASLRIGDHAKGRVVEVCGDAVEAEATKAVPVENIERCHTKLEIALFTAKVDVLQQGEVLAQQSRFAELRDSA